MVPPTPMHRSKTHLVHVWIHIVTDARSNDVFLSHVCTSLTLFLSFHFVVIQMPSFWFIIVVFSLWIFYISAFLNASSTCMAWAVPWQMHARTTCFLSYMYIFLTLFIFISSPANAEIEFDVLCLHLKILFIIFSTFFYIQIVHRLEYKVTYHHVKEQRQEQEKGQ